MMEKIVVPKQNYNDKKMKHDIKKLLSRYSDILYHEVIGYSVEERGIDAIRVGTGEKEIIMHGSHHAREWLTSVLLMDMIEWYAQQIKEKKTYQSLALNELFDKVSIWIVPMVNPDGVEFVQAAKSTPNRHQANDKIKKYQEAWKANVRGVDLNRQYPADWDIIDDRIQKPAFANYKGPAPLSEPEALSLYSFTCAHNFLYAVSYHASGEEIFWKYKTEGALLKEAAILANKLSILTGYSLVAPDENPSGGGFTDWFLTEIKRPAFTIEIAPYVGPRAVPLKYYDQIWRENCYVGLFLAKYAVDHPNA